MPETQDAPKGTSDGRPAAADPLFAPVRMDARGDPLIVVGLPRSGSSFLSHILSQLPDWYVFDDLYIHRKAREISAQAPLTNRNLKELIVFMGWQIRARVRFGTYAIPNVSMDEVPAMDAALTQAFTKKPGNWAELQEEWMLRLAHRARCTRWGYKMPGAFRFIPELRQHYPDSRFLYIMRNPYKVLASYNHMPKTSGDGDPGRYHPVVYAIYWRMAARSYQTQKKALGDAVSLVRFEELVGETEATAARLAQFLSTTTPTKVDIPAKPNSSFGTTRKNGALTGLETWLVTRIAGSEIKTLGYEVQNAPVRAGDIADIARTSLRFCSFHLQGVFAKIKTRLPKRTA